MITADTSSGGVPLEYEMFAIRSADGDTFAIYLINEDSQFSGVIANVEVDDVKTAGEQLLVDSKGKFGRTGW